jgi:hypothetical protein
MSVSSRVIAFSLISMAISLGDLAVAAPRPPAPPAHAWWKPRTNLAPTVAHVHRIFTGGPPGVSWTPLASTPSFNPGAMLLLTDGTVMVQDQGPTSSGSNKWWKLTPDAFGSYVNGAWTQIASMASNYGPLYFASAVLADGKVIVQGGEYNFGVLKWTNLGAIYNPATNKWAALTHPSGTNWSRIGDAPGAVLTNGLFMIGASGYSGTKDQALYNDKLKTWTTTGTGKADGNGEEGWSLLPDGRLLTVDTDNFPSPRNTEAYSPVSGAWTSAGLTPDALVDTSSGEVGPQILRPGGKVFAAGATGANDIFDSSSSTWASGPSFPVIDGDQYDAADGAAAVLPSGNVLIDASPGVYNTPTHFFLYDGTSLTQIADAPNALNISSFYGYMLVLPTGEVLFNDRVGDISTFTDGVAANTAWAPIITKVPTALTRGLAYTVAGKQLNGLTQGAAYGDDYQSATNYPLVRVKMTASGHVFYLPTKGMKVMSVAPLAASSAKFTVPVGMETGQGSLVVVANGIASSPVTVTVN